MTGIFKILYVLKEIVKIILRFFPFCIKPTWDKDKKIGIFSKIIIAILFSIFSVSFVFLFQNLSQYFHLNICLTNNHQSQYFFIYACIIGPIAEEVCHRLPLIYSKLNISLSLGTFATTFIPDLNEDFPIYFRIIFLLIKIIILSSSLYFILKYWNKADNILNVIFNKYRFVIFYFLNLSFAFLHLMNLCSFYYTNLFAIIFYLIPMLFSGLIFSYLRIKLGFNYGILAHIGHNSLPLLLMFI
jgi:hypothetical protein